MLSTQSCKVSRHYLRSGYLGADPTVEAADIAKKLRDLADQAQARILVRLERLALAGLRQC